MKEELSETAAALKALVYIFFYGCLLLAACQAANALVRIAAALEARP